MDRVLLTDGTELVTLGALHAGVDFFVGYPITPSSGIFGQMLRRGMGIAAPDEITSLQFLIGASLNGRKPMTATSAPGFLLMSEGIGQALAMETPLTVVMVQRLGPSTGSATANAQGDILLSSSLVSGGFTLPVICPSTVEECLEMTAWAVNLAEQLRAPTVLLTEKDMVVGKRSVDVADLVYPEVVDRRRYEGDARSYQTYGDWDERGVPSFKALGDKELQVRATASTHDEDGGITSFNERVRANTKRLMITEEAGLYPESRGDIQDGADDLVLSYGYTSYAAREAVENLRRAGRKVSFLAVRTLFPVLKEDLRGKLGGVRRVIVAEENLTGQYRKALLAEEVFAGLDVELLGACAMGRMITPREIEAQVLGEVR